MMGAGCRWGDQQGPASQFGRNRSGVVRQCKQKSSSEIVNRSGVGTRQDQAAAWMQFQKWSMPMSRLCKSGAGPVSCPAAGQDCDCPSCIVSLVVNNQLIFFRSENILYNQKNIWSTTCSSRTGSTRTPRPGGGARSRGECHWNECIHKCFTEAHQLVSIFCTLSTLCAGCITTSSPCWGRGARRGWK